VLTGAVLVALGGLVAGFLAAAAPIAALVAGMLLMAVLHRALIVY
jgi:hypothetical protein